MTKVKATDLRRVGQGPGDGVYSGRWSGNTVSFSTGGFCYQATTNVGVRGVNVPCRIQIRGGDIEVSTDD